MYSLHDITSGYPKLEPASDDGECNEDDNLSNNSDGQTDAMSEEFPLDNNIMHVNVSEYNAITNGNALLHRRSTISLASDISSDQTAVTKTPADNTGVSMGNFGEHIMNVHTSAPVYENGIRSHGREALYYPKITNERALHNRTGTQGIKVNGTYSYTEKLPQQNGAPEGLPDHQSSIYGIMPYVPTVSKGGFSPYQGLPLYSGSHRSLTAHEIGIQLKPCCNCPCHLQESSQLPAFDMKNQRPSVIMVPATPKVDPVAQMGMVENTKLRRNLMQNGFNEMGDSDSSDDDDGEKEEKYFRVNIDGTTARFKLTKEDWQRIPINTFPSGGRLLSGDWTRIFLNKVKESNPWCSFRFKNNHVRSENSRKIHSAVFFRGGAECKRPECNVKVRFVIRKEKGKHVDVTYVGNVCHNSQPGGSDATSGKKRRQVRRVCTPQDLHD